MYYMIDVGKTIFTGIGLIIIVGIGIWCLCINLGDYIDDMRKAAQRKRRMQNDEINKEKAIEIINEFEKLLNMKDIKIPNRDREGNEDEACIYGRDYYKLEESIIEILDK